jgi:hypothetical protein
MALVCVITFANVLVRYFTNASFAFTEEFSVFLLVVLTLAGASAALRATATSDGYFVGKLAPRASRRRDLVTRAPSRCSRAGVLRVLFQTTSYGTTSPASASRSGSTRSGCRCSAR